jgi:cardiolipin synthase
LLVDGKNAFPEIIKCIENAERSVYINMFIWRDDEIGNRVAHAVLTAAERGAEVYISVDRYGVVLEKAEESKKSFFHKERTVVERIKTRALEIVYPMENAPKKAKDEESELYKRIMSHPRITVSRDEFKADHSKYYIIDDKILFLGGINIEDKENGADMQGRVYGDYMAKLCGEEYVSAFRKKLKSGEDEPEEYFFGINVKEGKKRYFEMEEKYLDMISSAKGELHITMAYFSPLQNFVDAIVRAHERGVRVTVMIPERANFQNDTNRKTVRKLMKLTDNGITVLLSPRMLHTKMMINDEYISFGSTNITKKAFGQLSELNLFIKNVDSEFRRALMADIEKNYSAARRINDYKEIKYNRALAFFEGFLV